MTMGEMGEVGETGGFTRARVGETGELSKDIHPFTHAPTHRPVEMSIKDIDIDLAILRVALGHRFGGGITWLVAQHPDLGWIGGKHVGGGVFRGR